MATIPSLALIPSGYKGGSPGTLYSVLPTDGSGDFTFTRSGNATRVNSEGLIELVSTNVPRLNYPLIDGVVQGCPSLLLEPERRNLVQYSEDFSQLSSQSNVTITDNQVISPDGTQNAASFIDNGTGGVHRAFSVYSSTIASGQLVAHSIFAKAKEHKWFQLSTGGNTNDQWANFDLENGVIGNSSSSANPIIENYGNGWYRCILFATTSANNASVAGLLTLTNNLDVTSRSPSYSGNGEGVYIFGLQIEQGSYPTSYIPNYGTALGATRSAESCNNAGDVNTFNDSEGVLFAEVSALANDLTNRYIAISDGTTSNRILFRYFDGLSNSVSLFVVFGGVTQAEINYQTEDIKDTSKFAIKYKVNDFSLWVNGFEVGVDTSGSVPTGLSTLSFSNAGGTLPFYGNTKQIQYFDTALNDSDLETLTSWDSFSDMAIGQLYSVE
jgi:hypothetical protein